MRNGESSGSRGERSPEREPGLAEQGLEIDAARFCANACPARPGLEAGGLICSYIIINAAERGMPDGQETRHAKLLPLAQITMAHCVAGVQEGRKPFVLHDTNTD